MKQAILMCAGSFSKNGVQLSQSSGLETHWQYNLFSFELRSKYDAACSTLTTALAIVDA